MILEIETEINVNSLAAINVVIKFAKESRSIDELYQKIRGLDQRENLLVGRGSQHVWVVYQDNDERILKITE
jgi:ACT domain-containing protein